MVSISGTLAGDDGRQYSVSITPVSAPAQATTTTVTASPTSPAVLGAAVTVTATVSPAAAGTITFTGTGESPAPASVAVVGGVATHTFTPSSVGSLSLGASFTPADPTAFQPSTATAVSYSVTAGETVLTKTSWSPTGTWAWVADSLLGTTTSSDQYAQASVSGLSDGDHNAGFEFRASTTYGSGITVAKSGTSWKIEAPGFAGAEGTLSGSSGTFRAEVSGSGTVKVYWNGTLVTTQSVSASPAPTAKGVRLVAWQSTTGVSFSGVTASSLGAVPAPTVPSAPSVTGSAGNGSASLSWAPVDGATSYKVFQGGTQVASTSETSYVVSGLTNGTAYSFTVKASNSAGDSSASNSVSVTPAVVTSTGFLLGAAGTGVANGALDRWMTRGPGIIKAAATWSDVQAIDVSNLTGEYGAWNNVIDVAVGAFWGSSWSAAASGSWDSYWTQKLQAIKGAWGARDPRLLRLRFAHEFDGNWFAWSASAGDATNFVAAHRRWATIAKSVIPGAKLVFSPTSAGLSRGYDLANFWPGSAYFDVVGVDTYNEWPHKTTASDIASTWINGSYGVETWRQWAEARGVCMSLPEWGNAGAVRPDGDGGGGDAPEYVKAIFNWAKAHGGSGAGQVEYACYFNIASGYPAHFQLFDGSGADGVQPQTAAAFRAF